MGSYRGIMYISTFYMYSVNFTSYPKKKPNSLLIYKKSLSSVFFFSRPPFQMNKTNIWTPSCLAQGQSTKCLMFGREARYPSQVPVEYRVSCTYKHILERENILKVVAL